MSNRARALAASLATLLSTPALAQSCDTPMSVTELREIVGDAVAAIDQEDAAKHRGAQLALEERLPCLDEQLPSRAWADYLVTEAMIRHADELSDWQTPLQLALELVPGHPDVPGWMLDEYTEPDAPPGEPIPLPSGVVIAIDGRVVVGAIPPLAGLHVVQIVEGSKWKSMLLKGRPFPAEWLASPEEPARPVTEALASWGSLGLTIGFGSWSQRPPGAVDPMILDAKSFPGASVGLAGHGQQQITGPVSVFWTLDGSLQSSPPSAGADSGKRMVPFGSGFAGAALFDQPLSIWLGGGALTTRISTFSGEEYIVLPHYLVGVSYRSAEPLALDVFVGGGWGPWGSHFQARTGATVVDLGPVGLRVGGHATFADATLLNFAAPGQPDLVGRATRWEGGIDLGISWGVRP